jgi:hypothetical protein
MTHTVKPPKRKTHPPTPTRDGGVSGRLDTLVAEVAALRAEVVKLRGEVHLLRATGRRQVPPPLPRIEEDVITVDEREVTLESLRPPRTRR